MKPQSQITRQLRSHRGEQPPSGSRSHPAIDRHYHGDARGFRAVRGHVRSSASPLASSFRQISRDFLTAETKRDYLMEAFCFVILVSVSAWPMASMMRALSLLT